MLPQKRPSLLHRLIKRLAATRFGIWLLADTLHRMDAPVLRWSHNRTSLTTWLTGLPVVVLTTTGAKSGLPRQTPLVGLVDGKKIILIASQFGRPRNPSWYYNLTAHPQVQVESKNRSGTYRAREAQGAERQRYWDLAAAYYPGYTRYEQKAKPRIIPVIVLEPVDIIP
ncbi:nitroreductase family deazaflavin-dependent oxidoreductase [bacterium]|nr:nitroreductase family deazaflavin-dependent oxidoreductase [bacterium]MCB2178969.1 nitroreductase family deazaflavin-dependent oxidoreductase [bacterium]